MSEKLYEYEGFLGVLHRWRDSAKDGWLDWKEKQAGGGGTLKNVKRIWVGGNKEEEEFDEEDFSHVYRKKTRKELIRVSAAVMGIEFSYAAETAFVSPTLLKIGVEHKHMTLVWALSPLIGFFLTPILGSLSDRCPLKLGRRRPFIIMMSIGVLIGLLLVPNGEDLGYAMGDLPPHNVTSFSVVSSHRTSAVKDFKESDGNFTSKPSNYHPWGVFFTVLGTVLLDFDADACQSPARAYLLDVIVADDHARGLSTFTVMAGLGGFFGYALGGINWDLTTIGKLLGGHVRAVFSLITIIFVICVSYTVTSFKEIPLCLLETVEKSRPDSERLKKTASGEKDTFEMAKSTNYGSIDEEKQEESSGCLEIKDSSPRNEDKERKTVANDVSLLVYLKSIIYMPNSLKILCLTNLFCWMAHVCYSLYFTDFVGEAVFKGDPTALDGSVSRQLYDEGVRFGCWGMSMYSLSCACYSTIIEKLIAKFGARKVYVGGLLFYSLGMLLMAVTKHKIGVILFSWAAGVMYSTLFTMPYLLVAHYHSKGIFELTAEGEERNDGQVRGLGTDIAIVSSMVFLAQFVLSICMGSIVLISGTTTAVVSVASTLAFCAAISATQIMYLEL